MSLPFLTAICLTYGRVERLNEALACFLAQDYPGKKELIILNSFPNQKLIGDFPNVKIINCKARPNDLGACRNMAIEAASGDLLVTFDDDDIYLPNHLSNFGNHFQPGMEWLWLSKQFYLENFKIKSIVSGSFNVAAFTKTAWQEIGGYGALSCGEDRSFIGRVTEKFNGKKVDLSPDQISFLYSWGNNVYHISGEGDKGAANAYRRCEVDLMNRVRNGAVKIGRVELEPQTRLDYPTLAKCFLSASNLKTPKAIGDTCLIQLGKLGDIINILPVCKHLADSQPSKKISVMVSREFANIFDGVSYVEPHLFLDEFAKLNAAREMAGAAYKKVINAQIYGHGFKIDRKTEAYNKESWMQSGFLEHFHNPQWKPVFDKRDLAREESVAKKLFVTNKPKIVMNLTAAHTSPFSKGMFVSAAIKNIFSSTHEVVEIGKLKLHRIYDLIGIIERAELFISIDTATLHLAAATSTPVIALVNNIPWAASCVRYNCAGLLLYNQAGPDNLAGMIRKALKDKQELPATNKTLDILSRPIAKANRIKLSNVTLWACCWSDDRANLLRTLRVLRYCSTLFEFQRVLLFSHVAVPKTGFPIEVLQIPKLNMQSWNDFHNRIVPLAIHSEFAMSVHEDGMPLDPALWKKEFLNYDFIGAPWFDGVVGNAGFCIESKRLMNEKLKLPFSDGRIASDMFICRTHRAALEKAGIRFAPTDVALSFSTEQIGHAWPSFGFHGRNDQPHKYKQAWKTIEQTEL